MRWEHSQPDTVTTQPSLTHPTPLHSGIQLRYPHAHTHTCTHTHAHTSCCLFVCPSPHAQTNTHTHTHTHTHKHRVTHNSHGALPSQGRGPILPLTPTNNPQTNMEFGTHGFSFTSVLTSQKPPVPSCKDGSAPSSVLHRYPLVGNLSAGRCLLDPNCENCDTWCILGDVSLQIIGSCCRSVLPLIVM